MSSDVGLDVSSPILRLPCHPSFLEEVWKEEADRGSAPIRQGHAGAAPGNVSPKYNRPIAGFPDTVVSPIGVSRMARIVLGNCGRNFQSIDGEVLLGRNR